MATPPTDDEFLFTITGVFRIKGRGTVVAGMVNEIRWDRLTRGDVLEIRDRETTVLRTTVVGVEMFMVNPPPTDDRWPVGVVISTDQLPQVVEGQSLWKLASRSTE